MLELKFSSKKVSILTAMQNQVCYRATALLGGAVSKKDDRVTCYTGGFSTVFEFITKSGQRIAVRCWCADIDNIEKRTRTISSYLSKLKSPYFVNFEYLEAALLIADEGDPFTIPVVTMDWVYGKTLKDYLNKNLTDKNKILNLADKFLTMVSFFHQNNIAHGDLQHGNISVTNEGNLVVLDYDSMYVSGLDGMPDVIKGYGGYQHPARYNNPVVHSKLDYFSELVIYLSLLVYAEYYANNPSIWNDKTEHLIFSKEDLENPNSSEIINFLLKSSNSQIFNLTCKLLDSLRQVDILQLQPLEKILEDDLNILANDIIGRF